MTDPRMVGIDSCFYAKALDLRDKVLRTPLGRPSSRENRERDLTGSHFVAIENGEVIACLGLYPTGSGAALLRHMAVETDQQGKGVGRQLVAFAAKWAANAGIAAIETEARASALEFYERCGFVAEGEEYIRHGVPHRKARKRLAL